MSRRTSKLYGLVATALLTMGVGLAVTSPAQATIDPGGGCGATITSTETDNGGNRATIVYGSKLVVSGNICGTQYRAVMHCDSGAGTSYIKGSTITNGTSTAYCTSWYRIPMSYGWEYRVSGSSSWSGYIKTGDWYRRHGDY